MTLQEFFPDSEMCNSPAVARLSIDESQMHSHEHPDQWIDSIDDLIHWLEKHPEATAEVTRWGLSLTNPTVEPLIALGRFDPPSGIRAAIEEHSVTPCAEGYAVSWSFC